MTDIEPSELPQARTNPNSCGAKITEFTEKQNHLHIIMLSTCV